MTETPYDPAETDSTDVGREAPGSREPEASEAPEPDAGAQGPHDAAEAARKARGDAAGYRRRLRDVEAERDALAVERDALAERVTARQRADVEALAARRLVDGSDLWTAADLPDLLDEAGELDEEKVAAAVEALAATKPHYRRSNGDIGQGVRGEPLKAQSSFADVLRSGRAR